MADGLQYALMNFSLVMFFFAVIFSLIDNIISALFRRGTSGYSLLFRWVALLPLGITGIYAFIMHAFFPDFTASSIGWSSSPFQFEVAMADLAFGVLGILAFNASYGFRLATVIGSTCFLWGDAVGHVYQMLMHHNFSVGNAGSWFWIDILLPLVLIFCIYKMRPKY